MKTLKEALFNKKNIENSKDNKYGIKEKDMKGKIEGFPVGIVVRMMEEQELQCYKPIVKLFQKNILAIKNRFDWEETEAGYIFWQKVLFNGDFDLFFEKYPEYERYN